MFKFLQTKEEPQKQKIKIDGMELDLIFIDFSSRFDKEKRYFKNDYTGHIELKADNLTKKVNLTEAQVQSILEICSQKEIRL